MPTLTWYNLFPAPTHLNRVCYYLGRTPVLMDWCCRPEAVFNRQQ